MLSAVQSAGLGFSIGMNQVSQLVNGSSIDRFNVVLLVAAAVGAAVAVSGVIGFIGLVVPHLLRLSIGPDNRFLLPAAGLLGATLLVGARALGDVQRHVARVAHHLVLDVVERGLRLGGERLDRCPEREQRGEKVETTFVSVDKAEITGADVQGKTAQVSIRFLSKLITVTRDATDKVVDGSPDAVVDVTDVWTFERALGSRDPNWKLVATESAN